MPDNSMKKALKTAPGLLKLTISVRLEKSNVVFVEDGRGRVIVLFLLGREAGRVTL